ncbi:hypothetical protein ABZ807_07695 [Micromonospora sp. NPDC047548]|uniref:hypothetical protein n=1 Tax=Micromonospora sp. NPDC047548 TaxID=3155624 RepID=UPI0033D940ED
MSDEVKAERKKAKKAAAGTSDKPKAKGKKACLVARGWPAGRSWPEKRRRPWLGLASWPGPRSWSG